MFTLLMLAVRNIENRDVQTRVVRTLLEAGADPNKTSYRGNYVPLMFAGYSPVIELLVKHGAKLDVIDGEYGLTPLINACMHNETEAAKTLIKSALTIINYIIFL